MPNRTVRANCHVLTYVVSVTLYAILKIQHFINLLNVTHCHLSVEQRHLQQTKSP